MRPMMLPVEPRIYRRRPQGARESSGNYLRHSLLTTALRLGYQPCLARERQHRQGTEFAQRTALRLGCDMAILNSNRLASLIDQHRDLVLSRWRDQVRDLPSARALDTPTLNDHMPGLLDELIAALERNPDLTIPQALATASPAAHGLQRLEDAFDIEEVVAEYNILRGCIHDLAEENGVSLQGPPFHTLNRVFDQAIGLAVQTFATRRAQDVLQRREEYLAFVAHDLRTPLNAISLAGRVLEQSLSSTEARPEVGRMLKALRRNVMHLEKLVSKVIEENTSLKTEVGMKLERRDIELWALVEGLIHDLAPVAGTASTRLINSVPDELVAYADASLLKRIIQNLIANAIKHTPRGDIVIDARDLPDQSGVECTVADNGTGIREDFLDRVFEKGETDDHDSGSKGLGLAIVKTFVEAHGGRASVESTPGKGATFRFSLPAKRESPGRT
jgi:two-component system, OmpR family, phosphate regulon sensor histidine kinase PhoR